LSKAISGSTRPIFTKFLPYGRPKYSNSSAGTSSEAVALQLAVWWIARATSEGSGGGSCSQYFCSISFTTSWYRSLQYLHHLSVTCVFSVNFSPVADQKHCIRGWNFRAIDLTILKSCLEFPFEFAASNFTHMFSAVCCLYTLSFFCTPRSVLDTGSYLCLLLFSFPDCCESLIRYAKAQVLIRTVQSRKRDNTAQNIRDDLKNWQVPRKLDVLHVHPTSKKGDFKQCANYKTIAIVSHASKVFIRLIQQRIRVETETEIADEHAGFRQRKRQETKSRISEYRCTSTHSICALWTSRRHSTRLYMTSSG